MSATSRKTAATSTAAAMLCAIALATLTGCSGQPLSTREKATLAGGAIGAGTGAIVGAAVGAPGAGAAIGGALGAGTGMLVGNEMQTQETSQAQTQSQLSSQQQQINKQRAEIQGLQGNREEE